MPSGAVFCLGTRFPLDFLDFPQSGRSCSARFSRDFRPNPTPGAPLDRRGPPRAPRICRPDFLGIFGICPGIFSEFSGFVQGFSGFTPGCSGYVQGFYGFVPGCLALF